MEQREKPRTKVSHEEGRKNMEAIQRQGKKRKSNHIFSSSQIAMNTLETPLKNSFQRQSSNI
jgi:hypothetical protein